MPLDVGPPVLDRPWRGPQTVFGVAAVAVVGLAALSVGCSRHVEVAPDPFTRDGGEVVAVEQFTSDAVVDYREELTRIHAQDPDVLLLPNHASKDSVQVRQARELGKRVGFLGGDGWDLKRMPLIPEAEGTYVTHQWNNEVPTPAAEQFIRLCGRVRGHTGRHGGP